MIAFLDGWRYFEKPIQIFESKTNNQMIESNINFLSFVQWETSKFQICWRLDSSFHLSTFPLLHCMLCYPYILRTLSLNTTKSGLKFIIFKLIVRIIVALQVRARVGKQQQGRPCSLLIFDHDAKKSINILFTMMTMIVQAQHSASLTGNGE